MVNRCSLQAASSVAWYRSSTAWMTSMSPMARDVTRKTGPAKPVVAGTTDTTSRSTEYRPIWRRVSPSPRTTGSIGIPASSYSLRRTRASDQKWGGVQQMTMAPIQKGQGDSWPVAATHPTSRGMAPAQGYHQQEHRVQADLAAGLP